MTFKKKNDILPEECRKNKTLHINQKERKKYAKITSGQGHLRSISPPQNDRKITPVSQ